jgi:type I restriction enzyme, S subunit
LSFSNHWQETTLGEFVKLSSGGTPSKSNSSYWGGEIPWVSSKDMKSTYIWDAQDRITELGSQNGTRMVGAETILLVVRSMILAQVLPVALTKRRVAFNQDLKAIECQDGLLQNFLFHWIRANTHEILGIVDEAGHGTKRIQTDRLLNLPLMRPPLETQQKIATILSSYDNLIENNTRRIEILEDMARGLYREWFVNFRFPGHEEVEMVDSSLGLIPAGWQGKLEDCLTLQRGFDLPNSQRRPGSIPIYASTGITGTHDEAKVRGPGVVTGRSGSLGTVVYVQEDYWPLNTALWVKAFKRSTPLHSFFLLSDMGLEQYNSGAAVPTLNRNDVHGLPVAVPPQELLMQFDEKVGPMYLEIRNLTRRNNNLRRTRDLLLPKLISGEIDVSTLEIAGVTGPETASESV